MSDTTYYTAKCGLRCIFVKREGFIGKYAGIGVHFGGSHQKYYKDGKLIESKRGIAHFLEHKAFIMEDGSDALKMFLDYNADANAYTDHEHTIYYFKTNDEIEKPLRLLIKMFFTKGYTKENIESEKPIILSEYEETFDEVDRRIHSLALEVLYPFDSYSNEILGTKEDIKNMSYEDLDLAFTTFYTPINSILTIVGDFDNSYIEAIIEDELSKLKFNESRVERIPFIESKNLAEPKIIYEDIPYPELHILGRIDSINYHTPLVPNKMIALFDSLFSVEASFYKELQNKNLLLLDDIEYSFGSHEFGTYYHMEIYTLNPNTLKDLIIEKLKSLSEKDFDRDISMATIKAYKSDYIRALDSISYVGDESLSLALEGTRYEDENKLLLEINEDDIKEYIPYVRNSLISYLIVLPKNVKTKD